jgi:hypothetical protein
VEEGQYIFTQEQQDALAAKFLAHDSDRWGWDNLPLPFYIEYSLTYSNEYPCVTYTVYTIEKMEQMIERLKSGH